MFGITFFWSLGDEAPIPALQKLDTCTAGLRPALQEAEAARPVSVGQWHSKLECFVSDNSCHRCQS